MNLVKIFSDVLNYLNKEITPRPNPNIYQNQNPYLYNNYYNPYYQVNQRIDPPYQGYNYKLINNYYINKIKNFLYKEI